MRKRDRERGRKERNAPQHKPSLLLRMAGGWDLRDPLKLSGFKAGAPVPLATEDKE